MGKRIAVPVAENDWRVESDLNTLIEAKKIEGDKKRLAKVQAMAKQKMLDVACVATAADAHKD